MGTNDRTNDMDVDLTPAERKYAEKYIRHLERDIRQWLLMRWFMLIGSIIIIGMSIYTICYYIANLDKLFTEGFSIGQNSFNPSEIERFINFRLMSLRLEIYSMVKIGTLEILGLVWLLFCLLNWNHHLKSALKIKALKRLLSEK